MKKAVLFLIGLTCAILTYGQTVKIQGGTSISNLDWKLKGVDVAPFLDENLIGYSVFAGVEYLDKKHFNLSSNIGLIRKGGKEEVNLFSEDGYVEKYIEKQTLDYLSINTTIDLKHQIKENITPFVSVGPRFDYLINNSKRFDELKEIGALKDTSIGLILGGGLKYDVSNIQLGLRIDYYLDFTKIADWTYENTDSGVEVSSNTFTIGLSVGYVLK